MEPSVINFHVVRVTVRCVFVLQVRSFDKDREVEKKLNTTELVGYLLQKVLAAKQYVLKVCFLKNSRVH